MYIYSSQYHVRRGPVLGHDCGRDPGGGGDAASEHTPSSHSKNSATKICSKGWVAQKSFLIGSLTAALRFSKGRVRKDANLGLRTGHIIIIIIMISVCIMIIIVIIIISSSHSSSSMTVY